MSSKDRKRNLPTLVFIYLGVAAFSGIVTLFYYLFDHGLRDPHMTFLFVPGVIATLLFLILYLCKTPLCPYAKILFHGAFAFYWVYQLLRGIYAMAKAESTWLWVYLPIAGALLLAALIFECSYLIKAHKRKKSAQNPDI